MATLEQTQRLDQANTLIGVIAAHGRRFFYNARHDRTAQLSLNAKGQVVFTDDFTGQPTVFEGKVLERATVAFSHGGTLKHLIAHLADYVRDGAPLHRGYIAPPMGDTRDLWGYGATAVAALHAAAFALPIFTQPIANATKKPGRFRPR